MTATFILDMCHSTLQAGKDANNEKADSDVSISIAKETWLQIGRALDSACYHTEDLSVSTRAKFLEIDYIARVRRGAAGDVGPTSSSDSAASPNNVSLKTDRSIAAFSIDIQVGAKKTRIEVKLGRSVKNGVEEHWIGLQGNGTTLFTGQNIWPAERVMKSARRQLSLMLAWPFLVLLAVCKVADKSFVPPREFLRAVLAGKQVYQNVQFALYMKPFVDVLGIAIDLIVSKFGSLQIKASTADGTLRSFNLGEILSITAERYAVPDDDGRQQVTGAKLQRWQGRNQTTTLVFYDKAKQLGLSQADAEKMQIAGLLRADITLRKDCMAKVFTEAGRVAKAREAEEAEEGAAATGKPFRLDTNGKGRPVCSAANLIAAIVMLDRSFEEEVGERTYSGFAGWLAARVVLGWFHLSEIFGFSAKKWLAVKKWMTKWELKDDRYLLAFGHWRSAEGAPRADLKHCLKEAGFSADVAQDRVRELEALGFSGQIPRRYWLGLGDRELVDGATFPETGRLQRRVAKGLPVGDLLGERGRRMRQANSDLYDALADLSQGPALRAAPFAGSVTGVVKPVAKKQPVKARPLVRAGGAKPPRNLRT